MVYAFEKLFELPLYWSVDYICDHLRQEVDFVHEGENSVKAAQQLRNNKELSRDVYLSISLSCFL